MRQQDFLKPTGSLVTTTHGALAFVPAPIPRAIELDQKTVRALSEADTALGRLAGATPRLVNPYLIASPLLKREAILSSRIEGTMTTPEELVLFEAGDAEPEGPSKTDDTREVFNYIEALHYGLGRLKDLPICLRLIREVHGKLLAGVRGNETRPGEFRISQNFISSQAVTGTPEERLRNARYVPPPVPQMGALLNDLEGAIQEALTSPNAPPVLVHLALVHYQFEAIHPFADGNGRIGRLLVPLLLCSHERLSEPLLYVSSFFERNRAQYYDLMLDVSQTGNWSAWIRFFLEAVRSCALEAISQASELMKLREDYHARFQSARRSSLLMKLIDELFKTPSTTIGKASTLLGITPAAASANIDKLVEAGILVERTARKRNRRYLAQGIVRLIAEPAAPPQPPQARQQTFDLGG